MELTLTPQQERTGLEGKEVRLLVYEMPSVDCLTGSAGDLCKSHAWGFRTLEKHPPANQRPRFCFWVFGLIFAGPP